MCFEEDIYERRISVGPLVEAEELVMPKEGSYARPAAVYQVDRGAGQNDVGIVAWLLTLKTPECPQGRQVFPLPFPLFQEALNCITQVCQESCRILRCLYHQAQQSSVACLGLVE